MSGVCAIRYESSVQVIDARYNEYRKQTLNPRTCVQSTSCAEGVLPRTASTLGAVQQEVTASDVTRWCQVYINVILYHAGQPNKVGESLLHASKLSHGTAVSKAPQCTRTPLAE